MKKAISLALIVMFVLSLVPVFADEGSSNAEATTDTEVKSDSSGSGNGSDETRVRTELNKG
ncbi:hypothetical protein HYT53_05425 [Candidatus Woesearchaeota archaeon]|nr:hypothetical protein [Candidatus Woesearchaeota archaeon]